MLESPPNEAESSLSNMVSGAEQAAVQRSLRSFVRMAWASKFVRRISGTYATQIANIILGMTTTVLIARNLGPGGRGLYAVALATGNLGVQFGNLGLHVSNTYYVAKDRQLLPTLLANTLFISFGLGGLLAASAWAIFSFWPRLAPVQDELLLLGLAWIPFGLSFLLTENLLLGMQEVRAFNIAEGMSKSLGLCLVGIVILSGWTKVELVFAASFAALLLSLGWALRSVGRLVREWRRPSLALLRSTFGIGFKAYVTCLLSFLVLRIDLLMVKYLLGSEQAGYYSVAASMADVCLMLPVAVGTILFPELTAMPSLRGRALLTRKAALGILAAMFPLLSIAAILAMPIVRLVFGKAFLPSAAAFVWLIPGIFFLGLEMVIVQYLNSSGFPVIVIALWGGATLLNIGLNLWAIPKYGIIGASVVSSISYFLMFLSVLWIIQRSKLPEPRMAKTPVPYAAP